MTEPRIATWKLTEGSMLERSIAAGAVYVSYSDYDRLLAANKEKDAELRDRNNHIEYAYKSLGDVNTSIYLFDHIRIMKSELAALRASVGGENWITIEQHVRLAEHKIDQYLQGQGTIRLGVALSALREAMLLFAPPTDKEKE